MRSPAWLLPWLVGGVVGSACVIDWSSLDPTPRGGNGGTASAIGTGGEGGLGVGGAGGLGGASSSSTGGAGGAGGSLCGNGDLDAGEECDDANEALGDGCESCDVVCGPGEVESPTSHHCYMRESTKTDWNKARDACVAWGGDLVALADEEEHTLVTNLVAVQGPWWTGGNDVAEEGTFVWSNGEPWIYEPWEPGEPTDAGTMNDEDCIDLWDSDAGSLLGDNPCSEESGFVCERPPPVANAGS